MGNVILLSLPRACSDDIRPKAMHLTWTTPVRSRCRAHFMQLREAEAWSLSRAGTPLGGSARGGACGDCDPLDHLHSTDGNKDVLTGL